MLAGVYGWFTEGFDSRDLEEARAMLDQPAGQKHCRVAHCDND